MAPLFGFVEATEAGENTEVWGAVFFPAEPVVAGGGPRTCWNRILAVICVCFMKESKGRAFRNVSVLVFPSSQ